MWMKLWISIAFNICCQLCVLDFTKFDLKSGKENKTIPYFYQHLVIKIWNIPFIWVNIFPYTVDSRYDTIQNERLLYLGLEDSHCLYSMIGNLCIFSCLILKTENHVFLWLEIKHDIKQCVSSCWCVAVIVDCCISAASLYMCLYSS